MFGFMKEKTAITVVENLARQQHDQYVSMSDQIALLESDLSTWKRVAYLGQNLYELSDDDREAMRAASWNFYYKNPLGRSIINHLIFYIFGRGIVITTQDQNPEVQKYLTEVRTRDKAFKYWEMVFRTLRDGECFIRRFADEKAKYPRRRFIDAGEIIDIETSKDDVTDVKRYLWQTADMEESKPINADEIQHIKLFVDSNVKRGRPILEPVLRRLTQYDNWLGDRVTLNHALAAIFLEISVDGSGADVASINERFESASKASTNYRGSSAGITRKKVPASGTVAVHGSNETWTWNNPNVNAEGCKEDGRQLRLNIGAGVQIPEFMLTSDASNANFASTLVSESPFVKMIEFFQTQIFEPEYQQQAREDIKYGIQQKVLSATSTETVLQAEVENEVKAIREASKYSSTPWILDEQEEAIKSEPTNYVERSCPTKTAVDIAWPPIVSRDLKAETDSYAIHDEQGYASKQTISGKLGYEYEEEKRLMEKADREKESKTTPEPDQAVLDKIDKAFGGGEENPFA